MYKSKRKNTITTAVFCLLLIQLCQIGFADVMEQFKLADGYVKGKKYQKAEQIYLAIEANCPDSNDAMKAQKELVIVYITTKDEIKTEAAYNKLVADCNDYAGLPSMLYSIARKYESPGVRKYEKSLDVYQYIIQQYPASPSAQKAKFDIRKVNVLSLIDAGKDTEAQSAVDGLIADFNDYPLLQSTLYNIAQGYERAKKYELAKGIYQKIILHYPSDAFADKAKPNIEKIDSLLMINAKDTANADIAVDKLILDFNSSPELPAVLYSLAGQYASHGEHSRAKSIYLTIIADYPSSSYATASKRRLVNLGVTLKNANETQNALTSLMADFNDVNGVSEQIFAIGEQYYARAQSCEKRNDANGTKANYTKAAQTWDEIIKRPVKSIITADAYYFGAYCYLRIGEYDKAIAYWQKIVADYPDYQYAWHAQYRIGNCYTTMAKKGLITEEQAKAKLEEAYISLLEKYPDCPFAKRVSGTLASLNFKNGLWENAAKYFELHLGYFEIEARPADIVLRLAQCYEKSGNIEMAGKYYSEYAQLAKLDAAGIKVLEERLSK